MESNEVNINSNKILKKQVYQKIINSFKLTTHKITLIILFLTLTVLVSLLEIPTFFNDFLTIDFGATITLLAVFIVQLPYGILIAILAPWLRLIIPHTMPPNVIGELANMLSGVSVVLIFFLIYYLLIFCFNKIKKNSDWNQNWSKSWKLIISVDIICAFITIIGISLVNIFYNWVFILDLYGSSDLKKLLWVLFFPYNLFKFTLIFILFFALKKSTLTLKNQFNL